MQLDDREVFLCTQILEPKNFQQFIVFISSINYKLSSKIKKVFKKQL